MDLESKAWKYIYDANSERNTDPDRIAITDGVESYTYNQMFDMWKKHAAVFSALQITGPAKSRVGLMGTTTPQVVICFYALNIVGAEISILSSFNAIKEEKIIHDVKEEHLTDLILTDEMISEKAIRELLAQKDQLGLRNIILLHTTMGGSTVPMPVASACETKGLLLRQNFPTLYMDTLLYYYGNGPIHYDTAKTKESFILHTSGTTGGSGKPVVLTDLSFNMVGNNMNAIGQYDSIKKDIVSPLIVDLSNVFGMVVQVHAMLSLGATVVTIPGDSINPLMYRAIAVHRITVLFCAGAIVELWKKIQDPMMDFSSIKLVIFGGSYLSAADKNRYYQFFKDHGAKDFVLLSGYGISEVGGFCTLPESDINDESIGYALPGYDLKFFNEETEQYLSLKDAPCTGVLYIHSAGNTTGRLDGKQIINLEQIEGKPYVCTNDLIKADTNGKLTYLGRANRYFLNSKGEKYCSGVVETEAVRQTGIESCAVVPVFEKVGHDNLPMLCIKTTADVKQPLETVKQALIRIFKTEKTLSEFYIPRYILLAEDLPRNANGKIDLYKINCGKVVGQKYAVETIKNNNGLLDLRLKPVSKDEDNMIKTVYKNMAKEIASDAIPNPGKEPQSMLNQMKAFGVQFEMYLTLVIQQNIVVMNRMNNLLAEMIKTFPESKI